MSAMPRLFAGRRRGLFWQLLANGFGQAITSLLLALLLRRAIGAIRTGTVDAVALGGLVCTGIALLWLRTKEAADAERLGQDYVMRVRVRLMRRVSRGVERTNRGHRWGVTMTRLISDLTALRNWVSVGVARGIVATVTLAGLLLGLLFAQPLLAVIASGMIAGVIGVCALRTTSQRTRITEARRRRGRLANNVGEKVRAHRTIAQFARTELELKRVRSQSRSLRNALVARVRAARFVRSLPEAALPIALAALVATTVGSGDSATAENIPVAVLVLSLVSSSLTDLVRSWDYRLSFEEGRRRIEYSLRQPIVRDAQTTVPLPERGALSVRFGKWTAAPGSRVLVTGPGGSGKSAVLECIARQQASAPGKVAIAKVEIERLSLDSLRRRVQLISPGLPLLRGRIADNVMYGANRHDAERLRKVADACSLSSLLDDAVFEEGRNLGLGLRARVALARAAYIDPGVLLVDDPAFEIDAGAQAALERVLALSTCTTIIAAQQLDPTSLAIDQVWHLGCHRRADVPATRRDP